MDSSRFKNKLMTFEMFLPLQVQYLRKLRYSVAFCDFQSVHLLSVSAHLADGCLCPMTAPLGWLALNGLYNLFDSDQKEVDMDEVPLQMKDWDVQQANLKVRLEKKRIYFEFRICLRITKRG
jgi:hypothetical protein